MNVSPPRLGVMRSSSRPLAKAAACLGVSLAALAMVWGQAPDGPQTKGGKPASAAASGQRPPTKTDLRLREGTRLVDGRGVFRMTGQRVTFFSNDGQQRFVCLENLNLERIARAIADSLARQEWIVSGTVTEYQGVNFLLVQRAELVEPTQVRGVNFRARGAGPDRDLTANRRSGG